MNVTGNDFDWGSAMSRAAGRRITRIERRGEIAWLKDFSQASPPKWHNVQRALFFFSRLELLRPVPARHGSEGAKVEIKAINRFREIGVRVPEVLRAREERILLSDLGPTLREIERRGGKADVALPVLAAARELGRVHSHGLVHGRPILRNLTWDGRLVGFIDFEEQPANVMPLDAARARDILLLLISIGRRNGNRLTQTALDAYAVGIAAGVEAEFLRVVRIARPARVILRRLQSRSRDAAGLTQALGAVDARLCASKAGPAKIG